MTDFTLLSNALFCSTSMYLLSPGTNVSVSHTTKTKGSCKLCVDAGGEDWGHWKNLLEIHFAKENTCLLFSMSDFPQFIITFICCVKQMK